MFFKSPASNILNAETSRGYGLAFRFFPVLP